MAKKTTSKKLGRPSKHLPKIEETKKVSKSTTAKAATKKDELLKYTPEMIAKMSDEQIAKIVQDFSKRDPYKLRGLDNRFRYRFISRKDDRLDRQTMRGWELVVGSEAEKIAKETKIRVRQGRIIVGDGVLAKMPLMLAIAIQKRNKNLSDRMIGASSSSLRRDMGSKYSRNVEESLKIKDRGTREQVVI